MVKQWVLSHLKLVILLGLILILAFGGVRWCRKPTPLSVEKFNEPAKAKIDKTTIELVRELAAKRDREIARLAAENAKLRKAAESKVAVPFETAVKGGTNAMAELATLWTAPGTAEQLRARWRAAADPANPGR